MKDSYWVYILECCDKTLYTGIAKDPYKRLEVHNLGKGAKYTRTRRPVRLLYTEEVESRSLASKLEYQIKRLSRQEKIAYMRSPRNLLEE